MKRSVCWMLVTAVVCCQYAIAQDSLTVKPKSKGTALAYSLGATIGPTIIGGTVVLIGATKRNHDYDEGLIISGSVIAASGLIFGPGAGHAYAGKRHPFGKAVGRFLALAGAGAGVASAILWAKSWGDKADASSIAPIVVVGGAACLSLVVYDIATVGRSADEYNTKHGCQTTAIAPYYRPDNSTVGLRASLTF
ncbi:MAG TPA: hypothetical protein VN285_02060 [Candidatus Deferrimicrobium sp.]|nr:hypothetical protein [Candidatus Deferrimicrobium sp.]